MHSENEGFDVWLNDKCINVIHFAPAIQTTFCMPDLHVPHWAQPKASLVNFTMQNRYACLSIHMRYVWGSARHIVHFHMHIHFALWIVTIA
jgi:hypothetical protein